MVYLLGIPTYNPQPDDVEFVDGNMGLLQLLDPTRDDGRLDRSLRTGRPVDPTHVPTKVEWHDSERPMPDYDTHWGANINVSERIRAIIERFEPGVHQFLPLECQNIGQGTIEHRWFMVPCVRIDSVNAERTTFARYDRFIEPLGISIWYWRAPHDFRRDGEAHLLPDHLKNETNPKLVFDLAKIGKRHMWFDKHLGSGPYVSDALAAALREANLTGMELYPMESV